MCKNDNLIPWRKITTHLSSNHSLSGSADDCTSVKLNTDLSPPLSVPLPFSILLPSLLEVVNVHFKNSFSHFQLRPELWLRLGPPLSSVRGAEAPRLGVPGGTPRTQERCLRGGVSLLLLHTDLTKRVEVKWSGTLTKWRFLSK